jgi:CheY-like chemotaxis protein
LERLRSFTPDVVVTDLNMPRCTGAELCRRLKANLQTQHIPVLIVTGSMFRERDLLATGCDRVLTKPITANGLADAVFEVARSRVRNPKMSEVKARHAAS